MDFTFDPSGTPQQRAWVSKAIASCTFPLDAVNAAVTVVWSDTSPCSLAHSYMCTTLNADGSITITIASWADDPTNPNLRGLPNPPADVQEFYMESFVHELGHVVQDVVLADEPAAVRLFWTPEANSNTGRRWGTIADYSPAETSTLKWAEAIQETIAECVKCAFYTGDLIFMNRTAWRIDPQEWQALIDLIMPATGGAFDEKWAAPLDAGNYAKIDNVTAGSVVVEGTSGPPVESGYEATSFVLF